MRNIIEDFELLYGLAALCGFFAGWLLWRWRRKSLPVTEFDRLVEFEDSARSRMDRIRNERDQAIAELAETRQHSVARPSSLPEPSAPPKLSAVLSAGDNPLQSEHTDLDVGRDQLAALAAQVDALMAENRRLIGERAGVEDERAAAVSGAGALAAQVDALMVENRRLIDERAGVEDERAAAVSGAGALAAQVDALVVENRRLVGERAGVEDEHAAAVSAATSANDEILVAENARLSKRLSLLQAQVDEQSAKLAQFTGSDEQEVANLRSSLETRVAEIAEFERKLGEAQRAQRAAERSAANSERAFEVASARNRVLEARLPRAD